MTTTGIDGRTFITRYLEVLSRRPKPAALVATLVSDAALMDHIAFMEAAFAQYELVAEGDLVARSEGGTRGPSRAFRRRGRRVSAPLTIFYRIEGGRGRIAQHWLQFDAAAVVGQLQRDVAVA